MERLSAYIFIGLLSCMLIESHVCVHKPPQQNQVKYGVHLPRSSHRGERSTTHKLSVHVEYDISIDALSIRESSLIKRLLPEALDFLSNLLSVKQSLSTVLLNRQCAGEHYIKKADGHEYCIGGCDDYTMCGPVTIPHQHLQICYACNADQTDCGPVGNTSAAGVGISYTDFILYVSAVATYDCAGADMSAHASYCQLEAEMDRPIAGYINLCPHHLATELSKHYTLLTTIQHEIIHALGFSAALYAFYRDENGRPLTPRMPSGLPEFNATLGLYQWSENVIRSVTRTDWDVSQGQIDYTVKMLVTRKVVEEARAHFQCPSLEGIEVENHGGTGTEITHFEKRLLANEAMTGTHTHERIFSRLTLAVMEDTGWYVPNYDRADPLHWGQNQGCGFAKKSCKYWMDTRVNRGESIKPYCNIMSQEPFSLTCDVGRAAVALCNLHEYSSDLPIEYQYFTSLPGVNSSSLSRFGGSSVFADFCPFYQQFTYQMGDGTTLKGTVCRDPLNHPGMTSNLAAENYGQGSLCIESVSAWKRQQCRTTQTQKSTGAGCYQVVCDNRGLTIVVEGMNFICTSPGQILNIGVASNQYLHTGQLICPACEEICPSCPSTAAILEPTQGLPGDVGECPRLPPDAVGHCALYCESDRDCGRGEKCCSNGCGRVCQKVVFQYQKAPEIPCSSSETVLAPTLGLYLLQWLLMKLACL
ncbi:leishmanolysin-like peptidase [Lytechinus variegatus]|uniref:leishmanolysin-like peptidase n=1 Tax=Lytechinus variegatus TaxID=7654 RepID=UPI001BB14887|nr:leishmanolysin-like peptidase [Lytechinus variegatus]